MFPWQATVQNEKGDVVVSPVVTVYKEDGVSLADIYDESGAALPNPFTGTMEGFVQFFVSEMDVYNIVGEKAGELTPEWVVWVGDWSQPFSDLAAFNAAVIPSGVKRVEVSGVGAFRRGTPVAGIKSGWVPDGDVTPAHFGAPEDGASDNAPAFQAMFSYLETRPEIQGRDDFAGVRVFKSTLYVNGSLRFDAGSATYKLDGDKTFIEARGNANQSGSAIATDYVVGGVDLEVSLPTIPKAGQWVRVVSNAVNIYDRSRIGSPLKYRTQEFACVAPGSTGSLVKLQAPLRFYEGADDTETAIGASYTVANNARVVLFDDSAVFEWRGGVFEGAEGVTGTSAPMLQIAAYMRPTVSGVTVNRWYGAGVNLIGTLFASVSDCAFNDFADAADQNGYGVCDGGWYTAVSHCSANKTRHPYTTLQRSLASNTNSVWSGGCTVGAVVSDFVSYLATASHFDTHHAALDITFRDCQAFGGATAYAGRGVNVRVSGCRSRSTDRAIEIIVESILTAGQSPKAVPSYFFDGCDLEAVGPQEAVSARLARLYFAGQNTVRCCGWRQMTGSSSEVSVSGLLEFITGPGTAGEPVVTPSSSFLVAFTPYTGSVAYGVGSHLETGRNGVVRLDARAFSAITTGGNNLFLFSSNTSLRNFGSIEVQTSVAAPAYVFESGNGTVVGFPDSALVISTNLSAGAKFTGKGRVFRPDGSVVV